MHDVGDAASNSSSRRHPSYMEHVRHGVSVTSTVLCLRSADCL